jgi:signal transduction histidine kinase
MSSRSDGERNGPTAFARAQTAIAAARAADAMELEQEWLRLILHAVVAVYLLVALLSDRVLGDNDLLLLLLIALVFVIGLIHLSWILIHPGVNHLRRRVAVLLDMGAITVMMTAAGELGSVLYGLYLWVVLGNGFRFGRWYLHYAQVVSLSGFTAVVFLSPFWHDQPTLAAALWLVLLVIPWYAALLISRLNATHQRLEEARGEAEAANIAKTKFFAAASHDLRQPMQALSMYAGVLEKRVRDADAQQVVNGIQLSVQTLEQLFDSLLDISRIESGVIQPNVTVFPLMPLIEHVANAERPLAERKSLELRVVRTSANVRSDPVLLERMLKNLVTNAIRYTEKGRIVIGCRRVGKGRLRLDVVDSGIGIPRDEQERIFDEYYQVGGASAQGLGLGLPIVRSLSRLLQHPLTLSSSVGRGSVFSIELDTESDVAAVAAAPAANTYSPFAALNGTNVVLVDDDAEIRDSMRQLLEGWGCRIFGGSTVAEVEQKLEAGRVTPDALIVDYRLSQPMSGLQVIERLRKVFARDLPALIITGTANLAALKQRAGAIPIATKPVPPGKLRAFLSQVTAAG